MVVKVELLTKKVPKWAEPKLRELQAEYMLKHHQRISEAEIIGRALSIATQADLEEKAAGNYDIMDLVGVAKGEGAKDSGWKNEIDEVVYGGVERELNEAAQRRAKGQVAKKRSG